MGSVGGAGSLSVGGLAVPLAARTRAVTYRANGTRFLLLILPHASSRIRCWGFPFGSASSPSLLMSICPSVSIVSRGARPVDTWLPVSLGDEFHAGLGTRSAHPAATGKGHPGMVPIWTRLNVRSPHARRLLRPGWAPRLLLRAKGYREAKSQRVSTSSQLWS